MRKSGVRWAFRFGTWNPTQEEWIQAARCVQKEEKDRIGKFVFRKDAKSAMAGRLLMRKAISQQTGIPYADISLNRSDKGKPFLKNNVSPEMANFSFNVSHQGQFAVLATELEGKIGIDVMQVEKPSGIERILIFFNTMKRQFTPQEWTVIKSPENEYDQLAAFYRFWCLKESYVKALGTGIGFDLQRIDFHTLHNTRDMKPGSIVKDTKVFVDGALQEQWTFEETKLDDDHFVSVALSQANPISWEQTPLQFEELTFAILMDGAEAQSEADFLYWENFKAKDEKPPGRIGNPTPSYTKMLHQLRRQPLTGPCQLQHCS